MTTTDDGRQNQPPRLSPVPAKVARSIDESDVLRDVEAYCVALQKGSNVDRQRLLEKYPEIARELSECLDALGLIREIGPAGGEDGRPASQETEEPHQSQHHGTLGDFRILREIGRGGMGVVYEAEQVSLGRRVALKILPFAAVLDPRRLQRFQNEAQIAACLKHPNIVQVYSVGCERGVHYLDSAT